MSSLNPTITALIPCYNTAPYLRDTVNSVLSQTYLPVEIVLVDDGSTDTTASIIRDLASEHDCVRTIFLPTNQGVVAARNAGLAVARGDYIAMLDGDDIWTRDALAVRSELALRYPQANLIATDFAWFEDTVPMTPTGRIGLGPRGRQAFGQSLASQQPLMLEHPFDVTATTHFVWTGATLIKRSAMLAVDDFNPAFDGPEDTLLWLRLAQRGAFVFCPRVTSFYRQRPGSLVTLLKGPKELHYLKVLNWLRARSEFAPYRTTIDKLSGECHMVASQHFSRTGESGSAVSHAFKALSAAPMQTPRWRHLASALIGLLRSSKA